MFPIGKDGYIIDKFGIKGFGTFDMEEEEVDITLKEIFGIFCQLQNNCTHRHEPGRGFVEAVEKTF